MTDYQIGSLADLISGAHTPKKDVKRNVFVLPSSTTNHKTNETINKTETVNNGISIEKSLVLSKPTAGKNKRKKLLKLEEKNGLNKISDTIIEKQMLSDDTEVKDTLSNVKENIVLSRSAIGKNRRKKLRKLEEMNRLKEISVTTKEMQELSDDIEVKDISNNVKENTILSNELFNKRTVFVGNLPNSFKKSQLKKLFSKYGEIESVRFRCAPLADPRTSKKVAVIKREFHPNRTNIIGFVCFKSEDSAIKSIEANGSLVNEHHLRVDLAVNDDVLHDNTKAIFVGNLDFSTEEDDLWTAFNECGSIQSVRIIRDKKTNMGKGFGYVNFSSCDSVELALKLEGIEIKGRVVRIKRIQPNSNKGKIDSKDNFKRPYNTKKRDAFGNKIRLNKNRNLKRPIESGNKEISKKMKISDPPQKNSGFEGITSEKKKKKNLNKGELKKKKMVKMLAPRPKSST